jgi:hypothetical protein
MARRDSQPEDSSAALAPASASGAALGPLRLPVWRGFAAGILLLAPNSLWVYYMEGMTGHGPYVSTISLFLNVVFIIALLGALNSLARRLRPGLALNRADLIIAYVILTINTSIVGHDLMQVLLPVMTAGYWLASPQNRWGDMLTATTPSWLGVSDKEVLYGYYSGSSTMYQAAVIRAWLGPALWWSGFALVLVAAMVCIAVLVRPLWAERERLTFPIIQLPLELTNPESSLLRSRLLWIGVAVAGGIDTVNALNTIYPSIPAIPVSFDLMTYIKDAPWSGIGWLPVTFHPALIGLSFLMPLDLSFSCVFFFFWWKLLYVIATATGVSTGYSGDMSEAIFPWKNEQMFGGFIAIALSSILIGRRYFGHVWRRVVSGLGEVDDAREGLRFRTAAVGLVVCILLLVAFSVHGGMSPWLAVIFFVMYYALAMAVARVRAELGSPVHDFHFTGPDYTLAHMLGTGNLRGHDLGMLAQYFWFNRAYRGHPIAGSLEGLQMAARARVSPRPIVAAVLVAVLLSLAAGFWIRLHLSYQVGTNMLFISTQDWFGVETYNRLQSWIGNPEPMNLAAIGAAAAGLAVTLLLAAARTTFVGWPLHPAAYALSASWEIHLVWMPMLIAWLAKLTITRYGGLRLYRQALPFFFGLILGESLVGCLWVLIGLALKLPSYSFFT